MVRQDLIGHTSSGIEYIKGAKKVIFDNGIVIGTEEFMMAEKLGTLNNLLLEYRFNPEHSGFDYAYCKSTGNIRRKAVKKEHKSEETRPVKTQVPVPVKPNKVPKVPVRIHRPKTNWFDWAYPKIMISISGICSILSVYFTGTYMQELQPTAIAYFISVCMLMYGLVGTQMARRAFRSKHFIRCIIFSITSVCTLGFSMYTALDVNYRRYIEKHNLIVSAEIVHQNNNVEYELLQEELSYNKEQMESLSKTYVVMWDNEKNSNVVVEGKITEKAQNQINALNERNSQINARLIELVHEGTMTEQTDTEKASTIGDLLGALAGISGNIMQMLILLLPSIFIDLVNILSITIYNDRFESEEK